jgi:hypothetical protein
MKSVILDTLSEKIGNSSVLVLLLFTLFAAPVIPDPEIRRTVFSALFTVLFFMGALAMEKYKRIIILIAVIALITEWISFVFHLPVLDFLSQTTNLVFFFIIVARFIIQIAKTREVDAKVIIESINGYLLLGLAYSILVAIVMRNIENAYHFPEAISFIRKDPAHLYDYIYFTFVTFTTTGYGDIVPLVPIAKSLSLLISISGQIYIAIIIAMLVGKYAGSTRKG